MRRKAGTTPGVTVFILILCMVVLMQSKSYAGLLPDSKAIYGFYMPSAEFAVEKKCADNEKTEKGQVLTWNQFWGKDYVDFGMYLGSCGCSIKDINSNNGILTLQVTKDDYGINMQYDLEKGQLSLYYPEGTRPETERGGQEDKSTMILPVLRELFGGIEMPCPKSLSGWTLVGEIDNKEGIIEQYYSDVRESEYNAYSKLAAVYGCEMKDYHKLGSVASWTIKKGFASLIFEYELATGDAKITYFSCAIPSIEKIEVGQEMLFPLISEVGPVLPSAEMILGKAPIEEIADGDETIYVYDQFTESDYEKLSSYLQEKGCTVIDYDFQDDILEIQMEKDNEPFLLEYDYNGQLIKFRYSANAIVEKSSAVRTQASAFTQENSASASPYVRYSQSECYQMVLSYMKKQLKNPESLEIHSYSVTYSEGAYSFTIDYSAQNGFGGYNRETYIAIVDADTGNVLGSISF